MYGKHISQTIYYAKPAELWLVKTKNKLVVITEDHGNDCFSCVDIDTGKEEAYSKHELYHPVKELLSYKYGSIGSSVFRYSTHTKYNNNLRIRWKSDDSRKRWSMCHRFYDGTLNNTLCGCIILSWYVSEFLVAPTMKQNCLNCERSYNAEVNADTLGQ